MKSVIKKRRKNIAIYQKFLNQKYIKIPHDNENQFSSSVIFLCLCEKRDELQKILKFKGNSVFSILWNSIAQTLCFEENEISKIQSYLCLKN